MKQNVILIDDIDGKILAVLSIKNYTHQKIDEMQKEIYSLKEKQKNYTVGSIIYELHKKYDFSMSYTFDGSETLYI